MTVSVSYCPIGGARSTRDITHPVVVRKGWFGRLRLSHAECVQLIGDLQEAIDAPDFRVPFTTEVITEVRQ